MILIDGVMLAGGITKNEAPEMFENVLVFAGQNSPADGQFRDLSFSSNEGEQDFEAGHLLSDAHCRKYRAAETEVFLHPR